MTQPLEKMSTRSMSLGQRRTVRSANNFVTFMCLLLRNSGSLNFACIGIALTFNYFSSYTFPFLSLFFLDLISNTISLSYSFPRSFILHFSVFLQFILSSFLSLSAFIDSLSSFSISLSLFILFSLRRVRTFL